MVEALHQLYENSFILTKISSFEKIFTLADIFTKETMHKFHEDSFKLELDKVSKSGIRCLNKTKKCERQAGVVFRLLIESSSRHDCQESQMPITQAPRP